VLQRENRDRLPIIAWRASQAVSKWRGRVESTGRAGTTASSRVLTGWAGGSGSTSAPHARRWGSRVRWVCCRSWPGRSPMASSRTRRCARWLASPPPRRRTDCSAWGAPAPGSPSSESSEAGGESTW